MRGREAFGLAALCLLVGCHAPGGVGEFDGDGWVAGHVTYVRCSKHGATCEQAPIPGRVLRPARGAAVWAGPPHKRAFGSFGMTPNGHFGAVAVPAGQWVVFVRGLERPGCTPRPTFRVKVKMLYQVYFQYGKPGHCYAIVWEQPVGLQHPELRHVVARAGST